MKQSKYKMVLLCLIFLGPIFILFSACDKYKKHEVLTFFFTGVPHPDENIDGSVIEITESDTGRKRKKIVESSRSIHGPYAAERCYLCHKISSSRRIGRSDFNKTMGSQKKQRFDVGLPGKILSPVNKLCIECHTSKTMESAFSKNLWIHGPVSNGMCTICHNPHDSQYRSLLHQGSSRQMCAICHAAEFMVATEDHLTSEECSNCHNAHLGKTRFLLKKDFTEIY